MADNDDTVEVKLRMPRAYLVAWQTALGVLFSDPVQRATHSRKQIADALHDMLLRQQALASNKAKATALADGHFSYVIESGGS